MKVGDKVRILKNSYGSDLEIGSIGTIVEVDDDNNESENWYHVNEISRSTRYYLDELELITNSTRKEPQFMGRKKFVLTKESPELFKGAIMEEMCDNGTQDFKCITPQYVKRGSGYDIKYDRKTVMEQPKWFEEVGIMYVAKKKFEKVMKLIKKVK